MRTIAVLLVALLAACSDQSAPGPNLIIANELTTAVPVHLVTDVGGDTVLAETIAAGDHICRTVDFKSVHGLAITPDTTFAIESFWVDEANPYSNAIFVRNGTMVQTHKLRSCQL